MGCYDYQIETLANGLRVAVLDLPHLHSVFVGVYVGAGWFYEDKSINGVSHLLEHLHLATTARHPTRIELGEAIDSCPGECNAGTCENVIEFWFDTAPTYLARAAGLLRDVLEVRPYEAQVFEDERRLVLDEIASRDDHDVAEIARQRVFGKVPYGLAAAGTKKAIRNLSYEQVEAFDVAAFSPANVVVVVVGSILPDQLQDARRSFAGLPPGKDRQRLVRPTIASLPLVYSFWPRSRRRQALIGFVRRWTPSFDDRVCLNTLALGLMSVSSRLLQALRYGVGSNYHNYCFDVPIESCDTLNVLGYTSKRAGDLFVREVIEECNRLKDGDIPAVWFQSVKANYLHHVEDAKDSPACLAGRIGHAEVERTFRDVIPIEQEIKAVRNITPAKLQDFSCRLFRPENCFLVTDIQYSWPRRRRFQRHIEALS